MPTPAKIPPAIREYLIPDFSNWKDHNSYQEAFQSLLCDSELK